MVGTTVVGTNERRPGRVPEMYFSSLMVMC
jgi:hypothetical protein